MTIKKISELAGVSLATVSLALNNKSGVSEKKRREILEAAKACGYIKKNKSSKENIILLKYISSGVAVEQNGDFVARIIDSIENGASELGYNLIIKNLWENSFDEEIKSINYNEYSGIIFLGTEAEEKQIRQFENLTIPFVVVDSIFEDCDVDAVVMDNRGGILKAVKYLMELGHKEIAYIDSTIRLDNLKKRTDAYNYAVRTFNLEKQSPILVQPTLEGAYEDMLKYLNQNKLPKALLAANDTIAIGVIKAIKEMKYNIPQDVSIIGFDDIPFCAVLDRPLTTVNVAKERMGELAIQLLNSKIKKPYDEKIKILVQTKLLVRASTGNPM